MTLFLKLSLTLFCTMLIGTQAAFAPADSAALKAAVGTCTRSGTYPNYVYTCTGGCLGETADGSCPVFAASDATPGNPYGVIGDWDVSAVTTMDNSKCTLSPLSVATPSVVVSFEYTTTRVSSDHNSHTFCSFCFVFLKRYLFCCLWWVGLSFLCCTLSCSV